MLLPFIYSLHVIVVVVVVFVCARARRHILGSVGVCLSVTRDFRRLGDIDDFRLCMRKLFVRSFGCLFVCLFVRSLVD